MKGFGEAGEVRKKVCREGEGLGQSFSFSFSKDSKFVDFS